MGDIVLDGVTKQFDGSAAVDAVDLCIRDGELLALVGPSGCGKTTLLRLIAGLEQPSVGTVSIDGNDVTGRPARERDVGFVFQDYALFPHLDVRANLAFDFQMRRGGAGVDRRVDEVADLLDVADLLSRDIEELSGGQKQRVALGRAIVGEPTAFLLDEPLANLDAGLREQMQTEIVRLHQQLETTTIHVTHNQREAMAIGDQVAVMRDGTIQQVGTPESVYNTPASLFVARFVGSPTMNTVRGLYEPGPAVVAIDRSDGSRWTVPVDDLGDRPRDVIVGSRPEDTAVVHGERSGREWLPTVVDVVGFYGADRYVYLRPVHDTALVARVPAGVTYDQGDRASVRFDPDRLHVFDADSEARIRRGHPRGTAAHRQPDQPASRDR